MITKLPRADLTRAIEEVNGWLETAAAEPGRFAGLLGDGSDAEDVAGYLSEAADLREEGAFDDDGDFAPYLFCFLKALRAVLLDARAKDLVVVHVRYVYLFREVDP